MELLSLMLFWFCERVRVRVRYCGGVFSKLEVCREGEKKGYE